MTLALAGHKKDNPQEGLAQIREALAARSVVLIGLMGAGKTAVGKRLAARLDLPFVDADTEIETAAGMTVSEIFARHGEAYFREGERKVIKRLLEAGPLVLATGGGAFMNEETRANIKARGISIWLRAELRVLLKRVNRRGNRPLLAGNDPENEAFVHFDTDPLASASIAQVHAATLPAHGDGPEREVVVKVLRPGIERQIAADIALLKNIAGLVERTHPAADKIRPREIVTEIESTLAAELDLQREGANASVLRRFWTGRDGNPSDDLYVPEPIWSHSAGRALTMERVRGIPSDDIAALDAAGIDRKALAAKGVRVFYTQVFRDNFFHADAHAGNIWVDADPARKGNPRFIALDFGIMGQLSSEDQYYLAENFMAIFNRDYRRIAELHVQAGWMPSHIRIDELEAAARSVCEPYFTRPLSEISLAEVLIKLFRTAQRYELTLQPQLILLQKTLLNIEGVGRLLDPQLDIWAVARPVLERILVERYSPQRLAHEFRKRLPEMVTHAPDMPRLLHAWLTQQVEGRHELALRSQDLRELSLTMKGMQRRTVSAILGTGLLIVAAVLYGFDAGGPRLWSIPAAAWIAGIGGLWALVAAWPRR